MIGDRRGIGKAPSWDNKELSVQFGKNLTALRKAGGYTRKDLSKTFEVSEVTISAYERGLRQPNFEMLIRLAEYFYVSVDELIGHFDTSREDYIIEQYRLENALKLLSSVGYIRRTSRIAYALYVRNDDENFTKDADGNVKFVDEGKDVICFGGEADLIHFAESVQRAANSSTKTFRQVFDEKAAALFTNADAVKAGNDIMDYMEQTTGQDFRAGKRVIQGQLHIMNPIGTAEN